MAELKATVCLQGKDIEVISSHIEFNRKTDNKGRPVTNVIGGRITIYRWIYQRNYYSWSNGKQSFQSDKRQGDLLQH